LEQSILSLTNENIELKKQLHYEIQTHRDIKSRIANKQNFKHILENSSINN